MYKITLYDYCCNPICDGTVSYFVDDLDDFEKNWREKLGGRDQERVERFERSKNGEIITDYYSDDEELNIVQRDEKSEIIEETEYEKNDFDIDLFNAYNCSEKYFIFNLKYKLRKILFKGKYYIIAKYKITGISQYGWIISGNKDKKYEDASFYGNPVCSVEFNCGDIFHSWTPEPYKNDIMDSFVWHIVWNRDDNPTLDELNEEEIEYLLRDIIGEAG